jgi:hypothetical protein
MDFPLEVKWSLKGTASCHRGALRLEKSSRKFRRVHSAGHHWGEVELMAAWVLKQPVRIQYRGKANRTASMISTIREMTR